MNVERLSYSLDETAEMFGVSRSMVIDMVHRAELPSFHLGSRVLIPAEAIELIIARAMANFRAEPILARISGLTQDVRDTHRAEKARRGA